MTDKYAVFGNPIAHSKSPEIHARFAQQTEQDIVYTKELVEIGHFDSAADRFFAQQGKGLNVTVPFKEDAYRYADELSERAEAAEAVNTLILLPSGKVKGDNTDGAGLVSHIKEQLNWTVTSQKVLILGAGGAVKGVLLPLLHEKPEQIVIANRTEAKAKALAEKFSAQGDVVACGFENLPYCEFDLIINATSASLSGDLPPVSDAIFGEQVKVYDMVYGEDLTPFLKHAKNVGVKALSDGYGMLIGQAAESFYQWRGVRPSVAKNRV